VDLAAVGADRTLAEQRIVGRHSFIFGDDLAPSSLAAGASTALR
jgi:hypothetical protein